MHNPLIAVVSAVLLALTLGACAAPPAGSPSTPGPGSGSAATALPDLDASCRVDADCEVKNVGNCCGYQPACLNRNARPDPDAVMAHCAQSGMASVCGFQDIQACACVRNRCEPQRQSLRVPLE